MSGHVARPATRLASSSSRMTLEGRAEVERRKGLLKRRVKCGVLLLVIFDGILSLAGIILTYWWPGLSFASALSVIFTGTLILFIAEKRVKMSEGRLICARLKLFTSFLSFAVSTYEGVWSILLTVGNEMASPVPLYLLIAALVAYMLHFFTLISSVVSIWASTSAGTLPQMNKATSLPRYLEVKPSNAGSTDSRGGGLPEYDDLV